MRAILRLFFISIIFFITASSGFAFDVPNHIVLKTDFKIWELNPGQMNWFSDYNKTLFSLFEIKTIPSDLPMISDYVKNESVEGIDVAKIREYLEVKIAPEILRQREDVTIDMDENENVTFEGNGLYGRYLDVEKAAVMIKNALEQDVEFITLPIVRENPVVTVKSDKLKEMGIVELYSAGETNFANSPSNRINNIKVGLSRFNGHIIKPGEEFVFGNVLGPVEASTGFKPELVIKGDRTVPELGGGLCQVSTTAYRAALAGGLPVTQRRNHSYAVSYYTPYGLDATVYPPTVDLKFVNDSPAHILIQTLTIGSKAYYNYYGTKDDRQVYMIGPYYSGWLSPPAKKLEYTNKLAPGVTQMLGHAVPGLVSSWYRQVIYGETSDGTEKSFLDHIFSKYQARPDFFAVGASAPVAEESLANGY
jgi:vancomycin resistance protein YoaR